MTPRKRALTGIRASGNLHIGNYLGLVRPAMELTKTYECLFFIADFHALTTNRDPEALHRATFDQVATWLAFGFDVDSHIMFRSSDVPYVTELSWYLSCCTGFGLLEKAHAYKDSAAQQKEVNVGVFSYPVLMAADILLYDADLVPVGKDQKQHVEMTRDMAGSLNALFGAGLLKLPEVLISEEVMTIPGLDGRKMSKSYGNEIPLFCPPDTMKKLIMSIKSDSTPLEEPKTLAGSLIGDLYKLFSTPAQFSDLAARLANGGMGWGHAKQELFEVMNEHLSEPRARYQELRSDEGHLKQTLAKGAERADVIARETLKRVRYAVGVR